MIELSLATTLAAGVLGILLVGALLGTAGYTATVARRQTRLITDLTERLCSVGPIDPETLRRIEDRRLRESFERLTARVGETWTAATMDLLTGVSNRQSLLTRLDEEIERAARYHRQLSVGLIDIDHFKRLNDSYGHAAGDRVLRAVATVLRDSVRGVDLVGRYGGEEFMIVLPETDVDNAASIVEKLRRVVAKTNVALEDGTLVGVTISAGVSGGLGQHLQLDALIRDADAAMYSAKALGRNQVYVFHEVEDERLIRRAAIAPSAREAALDVGRTAMGAATQSLTAALVGRPGWAGGPSAMIAGTAAAMARAVGLPDGEIERIRTASMLHDLGKLAIPAEILSKPGELDEPEWRVVAEHPKIGQIVLEQAGALRDAATIVLHHHEWFDGRGYPHGLSGQDIPIGARIVAVADAYEAMVSGRPYRPAITHAQAIAELRRHAGRQFDPEIVQLFAVLFEGGVPWEPSGESHGHAHHVHPDDVRPMRHGGGRHGQAGRERRTGAVSDAHAAPEVALAASPDLSVDAPAAAAAAISTTGAAHDALHERRMRSVPGPQHDEGIAPPGEPAPGTMRRVRATLTSVSRLFGLSGTGPSPVIRPERRSTQG